MHVSCIGELQVYKIEMIASLITMNGKVLLISVFCALTYFHIFTFVHIYYIFSYTHASIYFKYDMDIDLDVILIQSRYQRNVN